MRGSIPIPDRESEIERGGGGDSKGIQPIEWTHHRKSHEYITV